MTAQAHIEDLTITDQRMIEMRRGGMTYEKIADALNMARETVADRCRALGLGGNIERPLRPELCDVLRRIKLGENAPQISAGMGRHSTCTSDRIRTLVKRGYVVCVDQSTPKKYAITDAGRAAIDADRKRRRT